MKLALENILTPDDLDQLQQLVRDTGEARPVRCYSPIAQVAVIGIAERGVLVSWWASPAEGEAAAALAHGVVEAGVIAIDHAVKRMRGDAEQIAAAVIKNAATP